MSNVFELAKSINMQDIYYKYSGLNSTINKGVCLCPFHDDNKPSMGINDEVYHCFVCNAKGNGITFVSQKLGLTPKGAAIQICKDFGIEYTDTYQDNIVRKNKEYYSVYDKVSKFFRFQLLVGDCKDYFTNRGISKEVQEEYFLGYCPEYFMNQTTKTLVKFRDIIYGFFPDISKDKLDSFGLYNSLGDCVFAGRYIFTLFDSEGRPVGFAGRAVGDKQPKYLNTKVNEVFTKKDNLYNYHNALYCDEVFVVEGYMDALSAIACGFKNVVAVMGASICIEFIKCLKDKNIILALDNDDAGGLGMAKTIYAYKNIKFLKLEFEGVKDFNEYLIKDKESFIKLLSHPKIIPGVYYWILYYMHSMDISKLENRSMVERGLSILIGANEVEYLCKYPKNVLYLPSERDWFWKKFNRYIKKEGNKNGSTK